MMINKKFYFIIRENKFKTFFVTYKIFSLFDEKMTIFETFFLKIIINFFESHINYKLEIV